jgi:hypothetical protein
MSEVVSRHHEYHSVPDWLITDYLKDLGAVQTAPGELAGDGWRAVVGKAVPRRIGSLVVGGAAVTFTGEEPVLEALFVRLHRKTLRGGG